MKKSSYALMKRLVFDPKPIPPKEDFKDNIVFQRIWKNCHVRKMNQIILITGQPRTGKSELCLDAAWALDRDEKGNHLFDPRTQIVPTIEKLVDFVEKEDRVGANIIWEEAGVSRKGANARKWQEDENILLNDIFQIMGLKRQVLWINLPWNFFLDKGARSLTHIFGYTKGVNPNAQVCYARMRWISASPEKQKLYYIKPRYFKEGRFTISKGCVVPRAPKHIRDIYLDIQKGYKPDWIKEIRDLIVAKKELQESKKPEAQEERMEDYLGVLRANRHIYWPEGARNPDPDVMKYKLAIPFSFARALARYWKREDGVQIV